jgi:hypothetical protein
MADLRRADDVLPGDPYLTGAYFALRRPDAAVVDVLEELESTLGLGNEFGATDPMPSVAYLARVSCEAGALDDEALAAAEAVVHVASADAEVVRRYAKAVAEVVPARVLSGQWLPLEYTGRAMHNFSYAHRVLQQPGEVAPHAFLLPMSKTAAWWAKSWLERTAYLLPRYDDAGAMVAEGHVLAAAGGIDHLLRRTYRQPSGRAEAGQYDFLTYFECTDDGVAHFHATVAALRDTARNPEWAFVEEGPLWHGRRVPSARALAAA